MKKHIHYLKYNHENSHILHILNIYINSSHQIFQFCLRDINHLFRFFVLSCPHATAMYTLHMYIYLFDECEILMMLLIIMMMMMIKTLHVFIIRHIKIENIYKSISLFYFFFSCLHLR